MPNSKRVPLRAVLTVPLSGEAERELPQQPKSQNFHEASESWCGPCTLQYDRRRIRFGHRLGRVARN